MSLITILPAVSIHLATDNNNRFHAHKLATSKVCLTNKNNMGLSQLQRHVIPINLATVLQKLHPFSYPLTLPIQSVVSLVGAIENMWENSPIEGKCLLQLGYLSTESSQRLSTNVEKLVTTVQVMHHSWINFATKFQGFLLMHRG